jgi:HEAT repeat protein
MLKERDVDGLVTLLESGSRSERRSAAKALGELRDARAVEPLGVALTTAYGEDEDLPRLVVLALGKVCDARSAAPLTALLAQRSDDQFYFLAQREALFVLANMDVFDPIVQVAGDITRDRFLRSEAEGLLERHRQDASD